MVFVALKFFDIDIKPQTIDGFESSLVSLTNKISRFNEKAMVEIRSIHSVSFHRILMIWSDSIAPCIKIIDGKYNEIKQTFFFLIHTQVKDLFLKE